MEISKVIKKAMVDKEISGAVELSKLSGVTYAKTLRLLKGDKTIRLKDAIEVLDSLGYELKAEIKL